MDDNGLELRRIAWPQAFPFVRLFGVLRLALDFKRLALGLACVAGVYFAGRILDGLWGQRGGVVVEALGDRLHSEVEAFAQMRAMDFETWRQRADAQRYEAAVLAVVTARKADGPEKARELLDKQSVRDIIFDKAHGDELGAVRKFVDDQVEKGSAALKADESLSDAQRDEQRDALAEAGDALRAVLDEGWVAPHPAVDHTQAVRVVAEADPALEKAARDRERDRLWLVVTRQVALGEAERLQRRGPFAALLDFEMRCFAAAVQGVAAGRWGFGEGALSGEPAMAGSIVTAGKGFLWLATRRFWYALLFGLASLVIFALFGGALCRSAAVQAARDESLGLGAALGFARDKLGSFLLAPLMPLIVVALIALAMFVGGLVGGVIPYLGEVLTGVLYPLGLLGGFAMALILLATLLGFPLMWPAIAVEGTDGFEGVQRAASYIGSRIWHFLFYTFVLLLYGGLAFILVRIVALLTLKTAHTATKLGMNIFSSGETDTVGKLDALWRMPAWVDLPLLPSTGQTGFWGTFHNAPLDATEWLATQFLRLWVYLLVGVVGAFIVSYFFAGGTQMYLLLRRLVDATDYEDVFYEEAAEEPALAGAGAVGATAGVGAPGAGATAGEPPGPGAPPHSSSPEATLPPPGPPPEGT